MTIITRNEYDKNDFYKLYDNSWSGARDTLDDIKKADKEEELMNLLEVYYGADEVEDNIINDFLWFSRDEIYENLGLDENGEVINDDDEDDDDF